MNVLIFLAGFLAVAAIPSPATNSTRSWEGCDFLLTTSRGQFFSPGFPENYPDMANCSWLIITPGDTSIRLGFNSFMTQQINDVVTIFDGPTVRSPTLAWYNGFEVPAIIESSYNVMLVTFKSDDQVNYSGFSAEYISYIPETTTTPSAPDTPPSCGGTLYGTGYILTPNYPSNYSNNANCIWYLQSNAQTIAVRFDFFDTESKADFVTVRAEWDPVNGPLLMETSSGVMGSFVIRALYNYRMTIQFTSDDSITGKGFRAYFTDMIN